MDADTTPPAVRLRLCAGAATSTGHRRDLNEDASAVTARACVVADGMGGHAAGEVAAAIAAATVVHQLTAAVPSGVDAVTLIHDAITAANQAIRAEARRAGTEGMGATLVAAVVVEGPHHDEVVAVLHVGDSRCYRLRDGVLDLVTRDHSLVQQLVDCGRIDPQAAAAHPMANVVTRALGPDPDVQADVVLLGPAPGRLLLCSDGLSDQLSPRTIGRVLAGVTDPQAAADRLVELVLAGPARDNVTAIVIDTGLDTGLDTVPRLDHHGAASPLRETTCCA